MTINELDAKEVDYTRLVVVFTKNQFTPEVRQLTTIFPLVRRAFRSYQDTAWLCPGEIRMPTERHARTGTSSSYVEDGVSEVVKDQVAN
ncbi:MAG TPA: hypothetical protein VIA62_07050 [Thermoanaerobaculia bacterium]|nr:hypothetical protein [Thermoanaerobaculia bacterium]